MISTFALLIVAVPSFIFGACFNQLITETRRRRSIHSRAYRIAAGSASLWGFDDRKRHSLAMAIATQFDHRAKECGIDEAIRELDAWERECNRTNVMLRESVVAVSKQDEIEAAEIVAAIEARLRSSGNVVSLKRPRR